MQSITGIQQLAIGILPIILAITVHEAAHGLVADKLGDNTARLAGRVTLNPFKHIDLVGTIILPLVMYLLAGFMFGWAKPVPVNWRNLGNPRRDTALVAVAGPMANFIMLLAWSAILALSPQITAWSNWIGVPLYHMAYFGILINAILMALNLLPLLPLDGGRILNAFLPPKLSVQFEKSEPWGFFILIGLLVSGLLSQILWPIIKLLEMISAQIIGIFL